MIQLLDKNSRIIVILFFVVFLCTGLFAYRDYGIPGDEIVSRNNGMVSYKYVFEGDKELLTYRDRYYGTAFELPLIIMERTLGLEDSKNIVLARHLATFGLFYIGVMFFYLLLKRHFKSWRMGLLGALFLVLSPRIFAHSFFNTKDAAFLSLYIISICTLVRYLENKTLTSALFHAFTCAVLVDVRIIGAVIPFLTVLFFAGDMFLTREKRKMESIATFIAFIWSFLLLVWILWPVLWESPMRNFIDAVLKMKAYPWEGTVLYLGSYVKARELPWHYIPVWISVTTPVIYVFFFIAGGLAMSSSLLKAPLAFYRERKNDLIFMLTFLIPLAAVIVSRAVLYDGWRHMFFIYAPLLAIALSGIRVVYGVLGKVFRALITVTIALSLIWTAYFMVRWHPYQNVYFNVISGGMHAVRDNFEMDYWGLAQTEALEYITSNDDAEKIDVYVTLLPGRVGHIPAFLLPQEDRGRLNFVDSPQEADYFISNYRWHKEDYPYKQKFFSTNVNGAEIVVVYKLK